MIRERIRLLVVPALIGLGLLAPGQAGAAAPADTVYRNGSVLTMDSKSPAGRAVAVRNGKYRLGRFEQAPET